MTGRPLEYQSAEPRLPHSSAGIASFVIGALCIPALFLSLVVRTGARPTPSNVLMIVAFACLVSPILGLVLGIIGLRSKQRRRVTAVIGVCLNGFVALLFVGLIALAIASR
jgi:hypothetical protein